VLYDQPERPVNHLKHELIDGTLRAFDGSPAVAIDVAADARLREHDLDPVAEQGQDRVATRLGAQR